MIIIDLKKQLCHLSLGLVQMNNAGVSAIYCGEFLRPKTMLTIDHKELNSRGENDFIARLLQVLDIRRQRDSVRKGALSVQYRASYLLGAVFLDNSLKPFHWVFDPPGGSRMFQ